MAEDKMAQATAVQTKYNDNLMRKAHVQGTAVGLAKVGGETTDEIAVVVLVDEKVPESQLAPDDIIPRQMDGVRLDVQEIGQIVAQ